MSSTRREALADADVSRRDAVKLLGAGTLAVAAGKAVDNVLLGYGTLGGTNLVDQDLATLAADGFMQGWASARAGAYRLVVDGDDLWVLSTTGTDRERLDLSTATIEEARALDAGLGLDGAPVAQVVADTRDVRSDEFAFDFLEFDAFFDRLDAATSRPYTVDLARGPSTDVTPRTVAAFTGVDPSDPRAVLEALVDAFRERTSYDIPRYVAGSVYYNVLLGTHDVRRYLRHPVDFEAIMAGDGTGLFCNEFTNRSIEALHAVRAEAQAAPVAGASVWDRRHKHFYTAVASAVREDGELVVPMTFVDYTHSTLNDDLNIVGVLGEGFEAYDARHRATEIRWW